MCACLLIAKWLGLLITCNFQDNKSKTIQQTMEIMDQCHTGYENVLSCARLGSCGFDVLIDLPYNEGHQVRHVFEVVSTAGLGTVQTKTLKRSLCTTGEANAGVHSP